MTRALALAVLLLGTPGAWAQMRGAAPLPASGLPSPVAPVSLWRGASPPCRPSMGLLGGSAQAPLHPLIVGSLADPAHPLLPKVEAQLLRIAEAKSAAVVVGDLAQAGPAGRLTAGAVARALTDPEAARTLTLARPALAPAIAAAAAHAEEPAFRDLVRAVAREKDVDALFDGSAPGLELDALEFKRGKLRDGKAAARRLGTGGFGVVVEHPRISGAVVKSVEVAFENAVFSDPAELRAMLAAEEPTARRLARAGAGPRYFGNAVVSGRRVSVREQVYGRGLDRLIADRKFGAAEERLVLELLDRMAQDGVMVDDMHPRNIMIGTTLLDSEPRAYLVDGGRVLDVAEATDAGKLRGELERQNILVSSRWIPAAGITFDSYRTFRELLDEGLRRASVTSRWKRFWSGVKEAFLNAPVGFR